MENLIEKEKKRRSSGFFKTNVKKLSNSLGNKFEEVKLQQKEKRAFGKEVKSIERKSYRSSLKKEAAREGRRKARHKFSKGNSGGRKIASNVLRNIKTSGHPGFMEMPGSNKKKKGDDAFNMF